MSYQQTTADTADKYVRETLRKNGITVGVQNNDINKALRKLKKLMITEGMISDMKRKTHHISKGEQRRLDKKAAIARSRKEQRLASQRD